VLQRDFEIARGTTERDLRDRSAALGAEMLVEAVAAIEAGRAGRIPQPEVGVSYFGNPPRGKSTL
jgi:methionyl-tRNA formyltransferase